MIVEGILLCAIILLSNVTRRQYTVRTTNINVSAGKQLDGSCCPTLLSRLPESGLVLGWAELQQIPLLLA